MRKWLRIALLASTALYPAQAHAMPPVLGFLGGVLAQFGAITPLIGFGTIGAVNAGFGLAAFLTTGLGQLLLAGGATALRLLGSRGQQQQAPTTDAAKINVRITEPERWDHIGITRGGGGAIFGEFDAGGSFWMIIVHGDSELVSTINYMLDDRIVELDGNNFVITDEFCLNTEGDAFTGSGTKVPYFQVWTSTFTPDDPIPPAVSAFKAEFPQWTDEHVLAGTCFSIVKCLPTDTEDRYKIYRWRGAFGIGEPALSIVGQWSRCYDPRDATQDIDEPSTWKFSRNPVLIWAWFRTYRYGRNKSMSSINWDRVAEQADICDQSVVDKDGNQVIRYQCGISIPESKERHVAEAEIMLSCDGMIMFDSVGKAWLRVGHYEAPTLTLTGNRDIVSMASREAVDGESETDGVIVRYIEPSFNYQPQPSAPWLNPNFYEEGVTPRYLRVDILSCQNHNQAMRLAKGIGLRSQSTQRLAPTTYLRGLKARQERIIDLQYDETFTGDYEIATPVEVDESGAFCGFGCVPIDPNRWTLLPGEELSKPAPIVVVPGVGDPALPSGVFAYPAQVSDAIRIEALFDASPRPDHRYEFEVRFSGETVWRPMIVRMDDQLAYSETVPQDVTHSVRYRTVSASGKATDYVTISVLATYDGVAPDPVTDEDATGGAGIVDLEWTAPASANYAAVMIFRADVDDIDESERVTTVTGDPSDPGTYQDDGLSAGTYYYWLISMNGSAVSGTSVATGAVAVT